MLTTCYLYEDQVRRAEAAYAQPLKTQQQNKTAASTIRLPYPSRHVTSKDVSSAHFVS